MIIDAARERCTGQTDWARLVPIATAAYESPARRPLYSVMDTSKVERAFGIRMADWHEQFDAFLRNLPMSVYTGGPLQDVSDV